MTDLACREITDLITDYLEDALAPADRRRFEAHLETCPYCTRYVEQMRATVDRLGRLGEGPA